MAFPWEWFVKGYWLDQLAVGKGIFGFCLELWCFVVDSWVYWDCCWFLLVFTAFCGANFLRARCGAIVVNVWLNVDTRWSLRVPPTERQFSN